MNVRFPTCCSIWQPEPFKGDLGRKSRPNFAVLTPVKLGENGRNVVKFFVRDLQYQPLMYFWWGAAGQGRRHNFESVGTNITVSEASRNILRVVPYIWHSIGTTAAKRHTESLSDSVTQEYACYNISYMHL